MWSSIILGVFIKEIRDEIYIYLDTLCIKQVASIMWVDFIQSAEDLNRTKGPCSLSKREFFSRLPSDFIFLVLWQIALRPELQHGLS